MAVVLALAATLSFGSGDFIAGLVSRRISPLTVALFAQWMGLALLLVASPLVGAPAVHAPDLMWGAAAGIGAAIGATLFFGALARGRMSVVAPVTAILAAFVPVMFGIADGERPGLVMVAGMVVALLAVVLVTAVPERDEPDRLSAIGKSGEASARGSSTRVSSVAQRMARDEVPAAVGAGLGFGIFSICLDRTSSEAGLWPLAAGRGAAGLVCVAVVALAGASFVPGAGSHRACLAATVLEVAATVFLLLAFRRGLLSLVTAILALYPAVTVVLARMVLHERLRVAQMIGLACATGGVVMMALG
ncbi:MAG: EamA family transporter [Acidimicrobiia bacterium]